MDSSENLILGLLSELTSAIRERSKIDPNFDYLAHFTNPGNYKPVTELELSVWCKLVSPEVRDALVCFTSDYKQIFGKELSQVSSYGFTLYNLILNESNNKNIH